MNCPKCRREVNATAAFCPYCQQPLKARPPAGPATGARGGSSRLKENGQLIGPYRVIQVWRSDDHIYRVEAANGKTTGERYLAIEMPPPFRKDYVLKLTTLKHPGLVPVFEQVEDSRRTPYLIVGDVQGQTLETFQAGMDANRAIRIFEKLLQVLIYLHEQNLATVSHAQPTGGSGLFHWLQNFLAPAQHSSPSDRDPFFQFQRAFAVDARDRVIMFDYAAWEPLPTTGKERSRRIEQDRQLILAVLYALNTPGGRLTRDLEKLKQSSGQMHKIMLDALRDAYPTLQALGEAMVRLVPSPDPAKTVPLPPLVVGAATARLTPSATTARLSIKLTHAALTNNGKEREHNEDNFLAQSFDLSSGIFVVADGMGGHAAGEVASQMATSEVYKSAMAQWALLHTMTAADVKGRLEAWVKNANTQIYSAGQGQHNNMGTTITAALIVGGAAYVANVGDSRTYLCRSGQLCPLTRDHSLVASLVQAGLLAPEQAYDHPQRNEIFRSLGQQSDVNVDVFEPVELWPEDRLVLCSDGLWEMVRPPQLEQILNQNPEPQKACEELIRAANQNGGEDNITVVIVRIAF